MYQIQRVVLALYVRPDWRSAVRAMISSAPLCAAVIDALSCADEDQRLPDERRHRPVHGEKRLPRLAFVAG